MRSIVTSKSGFLNFIEALSEVAIPRIKYKKRGKMDHTGWKKIIVIKYIKKPMGIMKRMSSGMKLFRICFILPTP